MVVLNHAELTFFRQVVKSLKQLLGASDKSVVEKRKTLQLLASVQDARVTEIKSELKVKGAGADEYVSRMKRIVQLRVLARDLYTSVASVLHQHKDEKEALRQLPQILENSNLFALEEGSHKRRNNP